MQEKYMKKKEGLSQLMRQSLFFFREEQRLAEREDKEVPVSDVHHR